MARENKTAFRRQTEGRELKLDSDDTAVFDKARAVDRNPIARIGLMGGINLANDAFLGFRTTEADKKPAKVVPFHEPHPDRIAISDAIRARIEAEERRAAASFAAYNAEIMLEPRKSSGRRAIPVVENPDTSLCCAADVAGVKAERNGRVLYWRSTRDADAAFGGTKTARRVENALMPGKRLVDPYGWRWTKLGDARVRSRSRGLRK